jgi:hypothetical protein
MMSGIPTECQELQNIWNYRMSRNCRITGKTDCLKTAECLEQKYVWNKIMCKTTACVDLFILSLVPHEGELQELDRVQGGDYLGRQLRDDHHHDAG